MEKENICKKIVIGIIGTALTVISLINVLILVQAKINPGKVPSILGYKPFIVLSGSMETEIYTDDLVIVKEIDKSTLGIGDIIAFRDTNNKVITHRIIGKNEEQGTTKFITKGDNNNIQDEDPVTEDSIEGKYILRIPKLGKWFLWISEPLGMVISLLIMIILILSYTVFRFLIQQKKEKINEKA